MNDIVTDTTLRDLNSVLRNTCSIVSEKEDVIRAFRDIDVLMCVET